MRNARTTTFYNWTNAAYIERLYEQFHHNPRALDDRWAAFFAGFELGEGGEIASRDGDTSSIAPRKSASASHDGARALVNAYRQFGHLAARLDPLGHHQPDHPLLELSEFGLTAADLDRHVGAAGFRGATDGTLRDLLGKLQLTYCGTRAIEYMDIPYHDRQTWLRDRIEPSVGQSTVPGPYARRILSRLIEAAEFEQFLHLKYIGQKRFSVEGAEVLLPLLDSIVEVGSSLGVCEIVIGMAHRGRLNVLAHLLNKPYELILTEFDDDRPRRSVGDGDVRYHVGYSHDVRTSQGRPIHLSLVANPSHLELVNPVIEGIVRAKQDHQRDSERRAILPVLIHGEAAFTGQGVVGETLMLCQLAGYGTGGTVHVIINNQLGFTTPPSQTRATRYPTDIARLIGAPVVHVNGDDPDAATSAAALATAFRQAFSADVMIDLWSYRRHGHNESDDPTFTQPVMYREIAAHPPVSKIYEERLTAEDIIPPGEGDRLRQRVRDRLNRAHTVARRLRPRQRISSLQGLWKGFGFAADDWSATTSVPRERLEQIIEPATRVPDGFHLNPKLPRLLHARMEMVQGARQVDWGCAELLAIGSLLIDGMPVRLTGQDTERGTFSHRHAVWHDVETGARYVPLEHLSPGQGECVILNTMLSELAVVGFEYGVSSADPRRLVIWEAQFGDFFNGAQPIFDQFIASAEAKWLRMSGLVLLLPHGFEGQGPEHSSARLERFLQLCARANLQIAVPTTPAQYFHLLRRQVMRTFRKPLILFTPKSLLRHKLSTSPIQELSDGGFRPVISDSAATHGGIRRLVLCSGKIYFELLTAREKKQIHDTALVRVEELYPVPEAQLRAVFRGLRVEEVFWVQEEPRNMGAWPFMQPRLDSMLSERHVRVGYVGRDEASSPATGAHAVHDEEQRSIIDSLWP
jgi:2-oxoglutarate dehydrogenase E1 component